MRRTDRHTDTRANLFEFFYVIFTMQAFFGEGRGGAVNVSFAEQYNAVLVSCLSGNKTHCRIPSLKLQCSPDWWQRLPPS